MGDGVGEGDSSGGGGVVAGDAVGVGVDVGVDVGDDVGADVGTATLLATGAIAAVADGAGNCPVAPSAEVHALTARAARMSGT